MKQLPFRVHIMFNCPQLENILIGRLSFSKFLVFYQATWSKYVIFFPPEVFDTRDIAWKLDESPEVFVEFLNSVIKGQTFFLSENCFNTCFLCVIVCYDDTLLPLTIVVASAANAPAHLPAVDKRPTGRS